MTDRFIGRRHPFRIKAVCLAVVSCFSVAAETVVANPTDAIVVSGSATLNRQGNVLSITNSPGAIINWRAFSVGSGEATRFIQQSAASAVLNRVVGADPSVILGALQSNGRVFLINPNGILFGAGAQIDVAGLVASSLNLSNADFAAGRLRFADTPGAAGVSNQGSITTPSGGQVYLIAPNVQNSGIITSPKGEVILAAGRTVELVDAGTPNLRIEITAPDTQAVNLGQIVASSGKIGVYAGLIKNSGEIRADGVVIGQNGEILLKATRNAALEKGSVVSASGPTAGKITIQADAGTVTVAGSVAANAAQGTGGTISIAGAQGVNIEPSARISADGLQGGSVLLASASGSVTVAAPVTVNARDGRGGRISINAAEIVSLAAGGQLRASGSESGGVIDARGSSIILDSGSGVEAGGASGGLVTLQAEHGAIAAHGTIDVTGIDSNGGVVSIAAGNDITLEITSRILARGRSGGNVRVESTGGTLLASGLIDGQGSNGPGGTVYLLAPRVALIRRALIDVTGVTGGGMILVGGDFQGRNPLVRNASRTYFGTEAMLRADALTTGDGGKVVIWSDEGTQAYGTISARGGASSGNGGFVEVSGKAWLGFSAMVNASAPHGLSGTLLLDPSNITISSAADSFAGGSFGAGIFAGGAGTSTISWSTIDTQLGLNNVVITTSGTGGTGDIFVNANHGYTSTNSFTLLANNQIVINGSISNSGSGAINMYAGWDGVSTAAPVVVAGATHDLSINRSITTLGTMTLKAGDEINVIAGGGNVSVHSGGLQTIDAGFTLQVQGGTNAFAQIKSDGGQVISAANIFLMGGSGGGTAGFADIIQTGAGASQLLTITGSNFDLLGGTTGVGNFARIQNQGTIQQINFPGGGGITLTGGAGTSGNFARLQALTGTQTINGSPNITLTGGAIGGLDDDGNFAQIIANLGTQTIAAGNTSINAGAGGINNFANIVGPSQVISVNGDLTLTGGGSVTNLGAMSGGGARIGGLGGATSTPTSLALNITGNLTMTGGSVADAGAAIGSNFLGGQTTDITITASGNVTLSAGPGSPARIGSPNAAIAGGDISVTAGGYIVVNNNTSVLTGGNVILASGDTLTEFANGLIAADTLHVKAANGIDLQNVNVQRLSALNTTAGDILINDTTFGAPGTLQIVASTLSGASVGTGLENKAPNGNVSLTATTDELFVSSHVLANGAGNIDIAWTGVMLSTLHVDNGANIKTGTGAITLTGDTMNFASAGQFTTADKVVLRPYSSYTEIDLGGACGIACSSPLTLTALDLSHVNAPTLEIGRRDLYAAGRITISSVLDFSAMAPAVNTLSLKSGDAITQNVGAPLTVINLGLDAGGVVDMQAANHVSTLAGTSTGDFIFNNAQSLTIGNGVDGIDANGASGAPANVTITLAGGASALTLNRSVYARGGDGGEGGSGGSASITLTAPAGIAVHGDGGEGSIGIFATGGNTSSGNGGAATINLDGGNGGILIDAFARIVSTGGDGYYGMGGAAGINMTATGAGSMVVQSSQILATGGNDAGSGIGGSATVSLSSGASMTIGNSDVEAYGASNSTAAVSLMSNGDISIGLSDIEALTGGGPVGNAMVDILSTSANVILAGNIVATGDPGGSGTISVSAPLGFIDGGSGLGYLKTGGGSQQITLSAKNGIGQIGNPVRIYDSQPIVSANNSAAGDLVLAQVNDDLTISDFSGIVNAAPNGMIDLTAETGNVIVAADVSNASGGVTLRSALVGGTITINGGVTVTSGAGAGNDVTLIADDMDIQGPVRSGSGFIVVKRYSPGEIWLGTSGFGGGQLELDTGELNLMSNLTADGGGLVIGDTANGPLIFKGPIGPTTAFLNVFGTTVSQMPGADITAGLNVGAAADIILTNPGNDIVSFSTGTLVGGNIAIMTSGNLSVTNVQAAGGVSLMAGADLTLNNGNYIIGGSANTVSLLANNNLYINDGASVSGGLVDIQAANGFVQFGNANVQALQTGLGNSAIALNIAANGAGGNVISTANITAASGAIAISSSNFVELDSASDGAVINAVGNVYITAGSSISAYGSNPATAWMEVKGANVIFDAGTFINLGAVGGHGLHAIAGDIDITAVNSMGGFMPGSMRGPITSDTGNVSIRLTGSSFFDMGDAISAPLGTITIDNGAGGQVQGSISIGGAITAGFDIALNARDFINLGAGGVLSTGGNVALTSNTSSISTAGNITSGGNVQLQASSDILFDTNAAGRALSAGGTVNIVSTGGNIDARYLDASTVDSQYVNITGRAVTLQAAGFIDTGHNPGNGSLHATSGDINITSINSSFGGCTTATSCYRGNVISDTGNVAISTRDFASVRGNIFAAGNVSITDTAAPAASQIRVKNVTAGSSITFNSAGTIWHDPALGGMLTAPLISLTAATGIGAAGNPFYTNSGGSGLSASNTATGDVVLTSTAPLFIIGGGGAAIFNAASFGRYFINGANDMALNGGAANNAQAFFGAGNLITVNGYSNMSGFGVFLAANNLNFGGSQTNIAGALGILAGNVNVNSMVRGGSVNLVANALNVDGGNLKSTSSSLIGRIAGDINVKNGGRIYGNPDIDLKVGGTINIDDAGSAIEAASANSIHLSFPLLPNGGFFINGTADVVWDPVTSTGFYAGGAPAVLGASLLVDYGLIVGGGLAQSVVAAINTTIAAVDQSITTPLNKRDKDGNLEVKDQDEKSLGSNLKMLCD